MSVEAEKAKKIVLGFEIPREELALRIAICCMGVKPPAGATIKQAFAQMDGIAPGMSQSFLSAADAAVLFFHECVNKGQQPS